MSRPGPQRAGAWGPRRRPGGWNLGTRTTALMLVSGHAWDAAESLKVPARLSFLSDVARL